MPSNSSVKITFAKNIDQFDSENPSLENLVPNSYGFAFNKELKMLCISRCGLVDPSMTPHTKEGATSYTGSYKSEVIASVIDLTTLQEYKITGEENNQPEEGAVSELDYSKAYAIKILLNFETNTDLREKYAEQPADDVLIRQNPKSYLKIYQGSQKSAICAQDTPQEATTPVALSLIQGLCADFNSNTTTYVLGQFTQKKSNKDPIFLEFINGLFDNTKEPQDTHGHLTKLVSKLQGMC